MTQSSGNNLCLLIQSLNSANEYWELLSAPEVSDEVLDHQLTCTECAAYTRGIEKQHMDSLDPAFAARVRGQVQALLNEPICPAD